MVDVLGCRIWQIVPVHDMEVVFEFSFIPSCETPTFNVYATSIDLPYLHTIASPDTIRVLSTSRESIQKTPGFGFTMNNFAESCHDLIAKAEAHPTPNTEYDVGFWRLPGYTYSQAEAFAYVAD